jgi:hypothetical protein
MRKLIAIIAALGLFGVTTAIPVDAASAGKGKAAVSDTKKSKKVKKQKKPRKAADAVIFYRIAG